MRYLAAAIVAVLSVTAVALAQSTAQNDYSISGSVSVNGGTKKKPKPGGLKFGFQSFRSDDTMPSPIVTYSIGFEGGLVNTKAVKATCTAAKMNAAQSNSVCPAKAKVGSGVINALAGTTGLPVSSAAKCDLKLTLYNGGNGHMPLWLFGTQPDCVASINQAIDAVFVKKPGDMTALEFTVPDSLLHPVPGLDVAVMNVTSQINKLVGKVGKKSVGFLASTGCKDKRRDIRVSFTDESGATVTRGTTMSKC